MHATESRIVVVAAAAVLLALVASWTPQAEALAGGGCGGVCCRGKNNSCMARGPRMSGRTASSGTSGSSATAATALFGSGGYCYCDESCLDTGDCCADYADNCRPVDCVVSDWFAYGECSKECGFGQKSRRRDVLVEPRNGGKRCPEMRQTTTCVGIKCKTARHAAASRAARETANIMPAHFGKYRTMTEYDFSKDIRKNLFYQYYKKYDIARSGYCSRFRVTSTRKSCANSTAAPWATVMEQGAVLCVECQKTAMERSIGDRCKGHGLLGTDTNWNAVNVPGCHGWWQLIQEHGPCTCQDNGPLDLIFV